MLIYVDKKLGLHNYSHRSFMLAVFIQTLISQINEVFTVAVLNKTSYKVTFLIDREMHLRR